MGFLKCNNKRNMKKIIKLFVFLIIITGVAIGVYRHMQPKIKCYGEEAPSIVVYDNDSMNADRLRALDCKFYKTTRGTVYFEFDPKKVDEGKDYGKSFALKIPITVKRKSSDDYYGLYYDISYTNEAGEYIYITQDRYFATDDYTFSDGEDEGRTCVDVFGCTCSLDDDTLADLMKTLKVSVKITDSDGKEYEEDVPLNMDKMTVEHEELTEEFESPFYVAEGWFE